MLRALFKASPLLAAAVLSNACASSGVRAADREGRVPCAQGDAVIVVRNETRADVEIVETRIGSGGRTSVAVLSPGRHEVRVRNDYSYSYSAQRVSGGAVLAATSMTRQAAAAVTIERECRTS
jgi:hypothetical protein